jgi:hypothetical protein
VIGGASFFRKGLPIHTESSTCANECPLSGVKRTKAIDWSSFDNLKSQEQEDGFKEKPEHAERFFREGRAGQWKEILTPAQVDRIVKDRGEQMARFGYLPL